MAYVGRTPANAAITASDLDNGIVTADKLATNAVTEVKVNADAITNAKTEFTPGLTIKGDGSSADGKLVLNCSQNSHGVSIAGPAHSAGQSYNLVLPTSVGSNGQVLATNGNANNQLSWVDAVEAKPTVANVSQTIAPATSQTFNITGTGFISIPIVEFIKSDTGAITRAGAVTFTNATTLAITVTLASGAYYVRVENNDGNAGRSANAIITASTAPVWSTAAGSLGSAAGNFSGTVATVAATSDSAITYSEVSSPAVLIGSGSGQANCALNSSTGAITTTDFGGSSTAATLYTFTLRATDAEGQTADRVFTLQSSFGATGGGQFN
ncbi:putative Ig domain-containing protein [bacterium]|nr:putative Ig domain-containing protein [bacterium]